VISQDLTVLLEENTFFSYCQESQWVEILREATLSNHQPIYILCHGEWLKCICIKPN
jgi:hypothetical protein